MTLTLHNSNKFYRLWPWYSLFIDVRHCCINDSYVVFIPSQWSFGVVLWEIVTLAKAPYQAIDSSKMEQHLQAGHRLPQPNNCPYDL